MTLDPAHAVLVEGFGRLARVVKRVTDMLAAARRNVIRALRRTGLLPPTASHGCCGRKHAPPALHAPA